MTGVWFCLVAFIACFTLGRRGSALGICAVLTVGYFNGITRANYLDTGSNFIFDSACCGFFLARFSSPLGVPDRTRAAIAQSWLVPLIGWPLILTCIPLQDYLVQLVGLRGNIFFIPFVYFGALLTARDWNRVSLWTSVLNLVALAFAIAEYFRGVEIFFPLNPVTEIIYMSRDLEGFSAYRIPATFLSAHAYGGTMALTIPLLVVGLIRTRSLWAKMLLAAGMLAVVLGVLMCAARSPFLVMAAIFAVGAMALRRRLVTAALIGLAVGGVLFFTSGNEKLERFRTLADMEMLDERIGGSVNSTILEAVARYPLGNGLGGGGTSMPYFLEGRVSKDIEIESEYARLQLELGLPGLLLWIAFIGYTFLRNIPPNAAGEREFSLLVRTAVAALAITGVIGIGLFTSIPSSALLFCYMGWLNRIETPAVAKIMASPNDRATPLLLPERGLS